MEGVIQEQLQAHLAIAELMPVFQTAVTSDAFEDARSGFGGVAVAIEPNLQLKEDPASLASIVAQIPWRIPNMYTPHVAWQVKAGEKSLERDFQKEREFTVLEAIYPRPSSIPESPAEPSEVQKGFNDEKTLQIPLVPLKDEFMQDMIDVSQQGRRSFSQSMELRTREQEGGAVVGRLTPLLNSESQWRSTHIVLEGIEPTTITSYGEFIQGNPGEREPQELTLTDGGAPGPVFRERTLPVDYDKAPDMLLSSRPSSTSVFPVNPATSNQTGAEPDIKAAVAAVYAALTMSNSKEVGSMIDNNLLIQLLKDPSLIEALTIKQPLPIPNSGSQMEFPSNLEVGGSSRFPVIINQVTQNILVSGHDLHTVSTMFPSTVPVSVGLHGSIVPRIGDTFVEGIRNDRLQIQRGTDLTGKSQPSVVPVVLSNMHSEATLRESFCGRMVETTTATRPGNPESIPRGFVGGNAPPGFGSNLSRSVQRPATQLTFNLATTHNIPTTGSARPSSSSPCLDQEYLKELILLHGCKSADDEDHRQSCSWQRRLVQDNVRAVSSRVGAEAASSRRRGFGGTTERQESMRFDRSLRDGQRLGYTLGKPPRPKLRIRRVCAFYGSSRGCRNGSYCPFIHDPHSKKNAKVKRKRSEP